jgi:cell division protein FtsI (penicillin-binding protein 3)
MFMAYTVTVKLSNIILEGDYYRKLAKDRTVKTFVIPANKGNIYSADGSLPATSIPIIPFALTLWRQMQKI